MAGYVDEVVIPYDRDLGPVLFDRYGADTRQGASPNKRRWTSLKSPPAPAS
ncbi:MAG: hypothetical protein ACXWTP_14175 [Methylosarcina sp.]